ncbi:hypothetical protein D3C73_1286890 [compost metagenome]
MIQLRLSRNVLISPSWVLNSSTNTKDTATTDTKFGTNRAIRKNPLPTIHLALSILAKIKPRKSINGTYIRKMTKLFHSDSQK